MYVNVYLQTLSYIYVTNTYIHKHKIMQNILILSS